MFQEKIYKNLEKLLVVGIFPPMLKQEKRKGKEKESYIFIAYFTVHITSGGWINVMQTKKSNFADKLRNKRFTQKEYNFSSNLSQ